MQLDPQRCLAGFCFLLISLQVGKDIAFDIMRASACCKLPFLLTK